jgi:hypothetical protein
MTKHLGVQIFSGTQAIAQFEDETEFDCDACLRVHFREGGDDYEDCTGKPYRICRRCQHLDIPEHFGLTLTGSGREGE